MPTKIIFDTEDQAMEDIVDTATEAKILKVNKAGRDASSRLNIFRVWQHVAGRANVNRVFG